MAEDLRQRALDWAQVWRCAVIGAPIVTKGALLWPSTGGMIKVIGADSDEAGSAAVLAALGGRGAARLLAQGERALLMEHVRHQGPGLDALALGGADEAALRVLCNLAGQVRAGLAGVPLPGLIPLDRRMDWLDRPAPALAALVPWARGLADEMLADRSDWTGLHGDLHHFNALNDAARGWLCIDPKGVLGPPVYDLANAVLNPFPHEAHVCDPARMARMAAVVAEHLGLSPGEVLVWVCLHGCLAASWDGVDGYWAAGARVAGALAGLAVPAKG